MRPLQTLCAVVFALLVTAPARAEPTRAFLLNECPWTDRTVACIEMPLNYGDRRTPPGAHQAAERVAPNDNLTWIVTTTGALGGGQTQPVEVSFWAPSGTDDPFLLQIAYLGQSQDGRTIVMSDRGPLTLMDPEFNVGRGPSVYVIDEKEKRLLHAFLTPSNGSFVMRTPDWISIVRTREPWVHAPSCLPAPELKPGLLSFEHLDCQFAFQKPPPEIEFSAPIGGDIASAPNADLDLIRKLTGAERGDVSDEALRRRTGRITGTQYLVVTPWSPDDC